MTDYGLPSRRDSNGDRKPVDQTYEWNGEELTVKILQPTVAQAEEYEELGEDISPMKMAEIVRKHLVKPEIPADDMTVEELQCYSRGIFESVADEEKFAQEVDKELEKRSSSAGN